MNVTEHYQRQRSRWANIFLGSSELIYPTVSKLCGLKIPWNVQGKDISAMLDDPYFKARDVVLFSAKGRLLRTENWAFLDHGKPGELYDMEKDPKQYNNLINDPNTLKVLSGMKGKLSKIQKNDLGKKN